MITINTPFQEMHDIFWKEHEGCEYWVDKQLRREGQEYKIEIARKHAKGEDPQLPVIEYKPSDNRWVNNLYVTATLNNGIAFGYDSVCYWETYGSFGAFMPFIYNETRYIVIAPGHFWQRVCERTGLPMRGVHTAMEFLRKHLASQMETMPPKEGDKRPQVAVHWNGGTGYGVEVSSEYNIFELRTFLAEENLSGRKLHERHVQTKNLVSEDTKAAVQQANAILEYSPKSTLADVLNNMDSGKRKDLAGFINQKSIQEIEEGIKALTDGGMTEDEAIRRIASERLQVTYLDKYGRSVTEESAALSEFMIRMREREAYRKREDSWKKMLSALKEYLGAPLNQSWKHALHSIYIEGYLNAWITVYNWCTAELSSDNPEPFHSYKHNVFVQIQKSVQDWLDRTCEPDQQDLRDVITYFTPFGFDMGTFEALQIATNTLSLAFEIRDQSYLEYLQKHNLK